MSGYGDVVFLATHPWGQPRMAATWRVHAHYGLAESSSGNNLIAGRRGDE